MQTGKSIMADFELKRKNGSLVDSSVHSGCLNYIEGQGMVPPGIEKALSGLEENAEFDVILKAEDMYGLRDEKNLVEVSREDFHGEADELKAGIIIEADTPQGLKLMTVKSVEKSRVVLDGNHPLAGEDLLFTGTIKKAAPATADEIEQLKKGCCCGHDHKGEHHSHEHGDCCGGHDHHGHDDHCCGGHGEGHSHHDGHGHDCCCGHHGHHGHHQ